MKSEANYHTNRLMQIETEMARLEEEKQYHLKRLEKLQEDKHPGSEFRGFPWGLISLGNQWFEKRLLKPTSCKKLLIYRSVNTSAKILMLLKYSFKSKCSLGVWSSFESPGP